MNRGLDPWSTPLRKPTLIMPPLMSLRDFLKDFIPPDYLIDGILQRRFVYAFTGQTGHAKTALALLIGQLVGGATAAMLGGHEVEQGSVVYFAGENPDDIRMRLIGANVDLDTRISVIPGIFDIDALRERLVEEITRVGPIDLVVIDTSAASRSTVFMGNAITRACKDIHREPSIRFGNDW